MLKVDDVREVFEDCLFHMEEVENGKPKDPNMMIQVEGIVSNFGFHKERVESNREKIIAMLKELPEQFHKDGGGGWSFLNACNDKHGKQWTGFHRDMEMLFAMGIAIGKASWQFKEIQTSLPGGVPYVVVDVN